VNLDAYLKRIDFGHVDSGAPLKADLETPRALHRAHQYAVPFENLDVQLRRPLGLEASASYDKIVRRRRGGWCYEMNGLMEWALKQLGFDVMRLSAGVMRERTGDVQLGNHLLLLVRLDVPYVVDVGFGGSLTGPVPLAVSEWDDRPYRLGLTQTSDGYWRFVETAPDNDPFTFDFRLAPAEETLFAAKCRELQTSETSPFIQNLVVQRRSGDAHLSLRGRVLSTIRSHGVEKVLLHSPAELVSTLHERFDLDVPEAASLWPAIVARHEALFGHQ
jgi:N-hydroxyarylamine O-acetyltransferase